MDDTRTSPNSPGSNAPLPRGSDKTVTSVQPEIPTLNFEDSDISGTTLGGYRLVRKIAEGGMGVVYEAIQLKLDRKVALKILTEELSSRPEFLKRFEREAKAAAALNHPNLVQVHDFGEDKGQHYMIMEFVDGEDLSAHIENHGKMSLADGLSTVEQAAQALKAAYDKTIIHRDIKPSNLMLTRDGRVKVSDLGLAKILNQNAEMTATGVGIGSPYFISPEQAADASSVDHRADIYSLGITLLFLLTGKKPFDGATPYSIVLAHVNKDLPTGAELGTELPPAVERLIQRMSAKDPEDRYQDYSSLLADLRAVQAGAMPKAAPAKAGSSKVKYAVAGGIGVLVLAVGFFLSNFKKDKQEPAPKSEIVFSRETNSSEGSGIVQLREEPSRQFGDREREPFPPDDPELREPRGGGRGERGGSSFMKVLGPPPGLPSRSPLEDGPVEKMLLEVKQLETTGEASFVLLINAYNQIADKAAGTPLERDALEESEAIKARHQEAVGKAIEMFTSKMEEKLRQGDPRGAWMAWREFPTTLRSREVDQRIGRIMSDALPRDLQVD